MNSSAQLARASTPPMPGLDGHVVPISAGRFGDASKSQLLCSDRHGVKSAREHWHENAEVESCR
jgi:hypothetical protein